MKILTVFLVSILATAMASAADFPTGDFRCTIDPEVEIQASVKEITIDGQSLPFVSFARPDGSEVRGIANLEKRISIPAYRFILIGKDIYYFGFDRNSKWISFGGYPCK